MASGKGHNPRLSKSRMLVRLCSGGQWTITDAKLESSLFTEIYRGSLCYFIPSLMFHRPIVSVFQSALWYIKPKQTNKQTHTSNKQTNKNKTRTKQEVSTLIIYA